MILLDTNVLSELMLPNPDAAVIAWLDRQPRLSVWISSITVFEVRLGLESKPAGRQRDSLTAAFEHVRTRLIEDRVVPFDADAALEAAKLMSVRNKHGFNVEVRDTMIAGIALSARATLATRNTRHFNDLHVPVVNPWSRTPKS
jgi:toxin FitB